MAATRQYFSAIRSLSPYLNPAEFLRWWRNGLLLWLPLPLRQRLDAPPPRLLLEVVSSEVVICTQDAGDRQELARYPRALLGASLPDLPKVQDREVVLQLGADEALAQVITLPQAAVKNLRQVIGFELDRLTPFPPQQIYYDAGLLAQQPATRSISVQFVMVLRSVLDPMLDELRSSGLIPDRVTVRGDRADCNLLPPDLRPRRISLSRRLRWLLTILVLVSAATLAALPLWQQRSLVLALIPQVNMAQQRAQKVARLRRELATAVELAHFLPDKRREEPKLINVIEELTQVIPDNTWVEQFAVRGNRIELHGRSKEASALLPLIEKSPLFEGATFQSPITRDPRSGEDRFYLTAQIVGPATKKAMDN